MARVVAVEVVAAEAAVEVHMALMDGEGQLVAVVAGPGAALGLTAEEDPGSIVKDLPRKSMAFIVFFSECSVPTDFLSGPQARNQGIAVRRKSPMSRKT